MVRYFSRRRSMVAAVLMVAAGVFCGGQSARGSDFNFVADADDNGLWTDPARWSLVSGSGTFPNGVGDTAFLQQDVTTPNPGSGVYTLGLNGQNITVGILTSNNSLTNEFITQIGANDTDGSLIFQNTGTTNAEVRELLNPTGAAASRMRINAPITIASNLDVHVDHNYTRNTVTEFAGKVTGAVGRTITKYDPGNMEWSYNGVLGAGEGFLGNIVIELGGLRVTGQGAVRNVAGMEVKTGGQYQIGNLLANGSLADGAVLTLSGIGRVSPANNANEGALRFQLGANSGLDSVFNNKIVLASTDVKIRSNVLGTSGSLTNEISGPGKLLIDSQNQSILILSGANTYQGGTALTLNSRTLINNTTGSGVGTGDVTVTGANTLLGGTGFIGTPSDASNVTVTDGILSPGTSDLTVDTGPQLQPSLPGTLTIHGNLTVSGTAPKLNMDLTDAQSDLLVVNGNIDLGTTMALNIVPSTFVPTTHHAFTLIDNQGANPITGKFSNFATEGASTMLGTQEYRMTYAGGDGNDVVLAPFLAGDYNANGVVDAADYVLWRNGGPLFNEVDVPGTVDDQDYFEWRSRFGNTLASGSAASSLAGAIPEPGTASLAALALSAVLTGVRRRCRLVGA
jgi:hypothetical protein